MLRQIRGWLYRRGGSYKWFEGVKLAERAMQESDPFRPVSPMPQIRYGMRDYYMFIWSQLEMEFWKNNESTDL